MVKLNRMVMARENVYNDARKDSLTHCTLTVHIVISDGRVKIDSTDVQRRGKRLLKFTYTCTREV